MLKLEERGTFSRNSAGDEATHLKVIRDGQATSGSSVIGQRKEGLSYVIDDARQQYRVVPWPESKAVTNEAERQSTPAVTRTIDGIKCVAVPVRDNTGKIVGKDWVSPDHWDHGAVRDGRAESANGRCDRTGGRGTRGDSYRNSARSRGVRHSRRIQASGRRRSPLKKRSSPNGSGNRLKHKGCVGSEA